MKTSSILMVCTGNICRSPSAEGVLRAKLAAVGLDHAITVDSAGTLDYHTGEPPDPRAVRQAALRGYDLRPQRARRFRARDHKDFDLILAMDRGHLAFLKRFCPRGYAERLHLFMDFAPLQSGYRGSDVPDPYYGDDQDFDAMLDRIELGVEGLLADLRQMWR